MFLKIIFIWVSFIIGISLAQAQTTHQLLLEGDLFYEKEDYSKAAKQYQKAVDKDPSSMKAHYNLANSLYKQKKYKDASNSFQEAISYAQNDMQKVNTYHNMGNSHYAEAQNAKKSLQEKMQAIKNAGGPSSTEEEEELKEMFKSTIEYYKNARKAYKDALRLHPHDFDTKNNLAHVQRTLSNLVPPPQKQQQKQEQQQDKNQDKQEQNPDNPQKQEKDKDQDKQEQPIQQNPQNDKKDPKEMTKEEVERLMQIIENEDKKVQEKLLKRLKGMRKNPDKSW